MTRIELTIANWFESKLIAPNPPIKPNFIARDYLAEKYERILRLREIARKDASEAVKRGEPYSQIKLIQAERLLTMITERLNARPTIFNRFNQN